MCIRDRLRTDRAITGETTTGQKQVGGRFNGAGMFREVEDDGVKPISHFLDVRNGFFDGALDVVMMRGLVPAGDDAAKILKSHFGVFTSWLNGDMAAFGAEDTLDVHGQPSATKACFKNGISRSQSESSDKETSVLASNGLGATSHSSAEFWEARWGSLEFLLADGHGAANRCFHQGLIRIENAQAFDFQLLVVHFDDVRLPILLNKHGPIC